MGVAVFVRLFPEEKLHPGVGPVLHGHGMNLRHLGARVGLLHERQHPGGREGLEGVASLVSQHVHIGAGAIEVGENEGHLHAGQEGAVAAAPFGRLGFQVKHLVLHHPVEEPAGLGGQLPVHLLGRGHQLLAGAPGNGIALGIGQGLIIVVKLVDAQILFLLLKNLHGQGRDLVSDLTAEVLGILQGVVITAPLQVSHLDIALKAQLLGHVAADSDHLIVDPVQLGSHLLVQAGPGLKGLLADGAVCVFHIFQQAVEVAFLSVEVDGAARGSLGILLLQVCLLHLVFNDGLGGQPLLGLHAVHADGAELLHKILQEGRIQQGFAGFLLQQTQLGHFAVQIFHFRLIELVGGIDGIADAGDGHHAPEGCPGFFVIHIAGLQLFIASGVFQFLGKGFGFFGSGCHVGPLVGHFSEFHQIAFLSDAFIYS